MPHNLNRRTILKMLGYTVVGSGVTAFGIHRYGTRIETEWLKTERVTIPVKHLGSSFEGFKIVHLSDFHLYPHTQIEFIEWVVGAANELSPDLIALTGDYVSGYSSRNSEAIFELAPVLSKLNAKHGVFSVLGNHDCSTNRSVVLGSLKECGLPVLINDGVALSRGQQTLYLAGLDDARRGHPDLSKALEKRPGEVPTVLLVHEPDFADTYSNDGTISLQLSGHSHGGRFDYPASGQSLCPVMVENTIRVCIAFKICGPTRHAALESLVHPSGLTADLNLLRSRWCEPSFSRQDSVAYLSQR